MFFHAFHSAVSFAESFFRICALFMRGFDFAAVAGDGDAVAWG